MKLGLSALLLALLTIAGPAGRQVSHGTPARVTPHQVSLPLGAGLMKDLAEYGIRSVIPRVPLGYAAVTKNEAVHVAARHLDLGPGAHVGEVELIAIQGRAISPLRDGQIVWAILFEPSTKKTRRGYAVVFVDCRTGRTLGQLS